MRRLARLLENWQLKILSVVFAVALWAFVASEEQGEAVFSVPLALTHVPPGMEVTALGPEAVDVRVKGLRHVLRRVDERELRVELSLSGARPGDVALRIRPEHVAAPRGVQVVRITPSVVRATLEPAAAAAPRPAS
jgi:YbbR domain-containing protein